MESYKQEFIKFMIDSDVLKFGDFTLKSGRKSPFFMNAGAYVTGSQLMKLGEYYAKAIHDAYGDDFDVLFGPAYKGIPLSVATTIAYSRLFNKDGLGAIVNSSRGIIGAYKQEKYSSFGEEEYALAARRAVLDMKEDIASALN